MFAFKDRLGRGKPTTPDLTRSLHTAITGISRYTVDGPDDELNTFRNDILALAAHIQHQASGLEIDSSVEKALELFRDYNARSFKFNQTHVTELKAVMRTMTETITYLSESRTRSVHQLQFVERELEQAAQIDDIRLLHSRLIGCLDIVREETARLQNEAAVRSQEVRDQIGRAITAAEAPNSRFGVMDTVTGLPSRRAAERTVNEALKSGKTFAVAAFVVVRLSAINARYGRGVGDEVMLRVANHFARHLTCDALLYRWSGPALVALININDDLETVKNAWLKAASVRQEISLETKERSVYVVVETSMFFQAVSEAIDQQLLFHNLDKFIAECDDSGLEI